MSEYGVYCTQQDIEWLDYCDGCFEQFPGSAPREAHVAACVAYRSFLIEEKLEAQERDDEQRRERLGSA